MKAALALFALISCVATAAAVDSDAVNNPFDPATDSLAEWLRATRRSNFAARLSDLYEEVNPAKLKEIDTIVAKYETRSKTLFQALYKKYPKSKQAVAQKEKESTLKDKENAKYTLMKSGEILLTTKVKLVDDLTIKANQALDDGKSMEAMEMYLDILRMDTEDPNAVTRLGWMYQSSGKPAEAVAIYEDIVPRAQDYTGLRFNYGSALLRVGEPQKALDEFVAVLDYCTQQVNRNNAECKGPAKKKKREAEDILASAAKKQVSVEDAEAEIEGQAILVELYKMGETDLSSFQA